MTKRWSHKKQTGQNIPQGRNEPCECGSRRKREKCCEAHPVPSRYAAYENMDEYPTMTPGFFANDVIPMEPAEWPSFEAEKTTVHQSSDLRLRNGTDSPNGERTS